MPSVTFKGERLRLAGNLPRRGDHAVDFVLTTTALEDVGLAAFAGRPKVISIVPSLDTRICALSTQTFERMAADRPDVAVLIVSADLPFAQKRFVEANGLRHVIPLSMMRDRQFAKDYGVLIAEGPLRTLSARAVVVLDASDIVRHVELVPDIGQEPDYAAAFTALDG